MSTEDEKVSKEAWHNIEICCQTLCDNQAVMEYIRKLEEEVRWLREVLEAARKV